VIRGDFSADELDHSRFGGGGAGVGVGPNPISGSSGQGAWNFAGEGVAFGIDPVGASTATDG
jgi:hypothetical protein